MSNQRARDYCGNLTFTMEPCEDDYITFLEGNKQYVYTLLSGLFKSLQGTYILKSDSFTRDDLNRFIQAQKNAQKSPEVQQLLEKIDALENIRVIQDRIIKRYER